MAAMIRPPMFSFSTATASFVTRAAFDDSRFADAATVTSPDTRNAIGALLAGRPVPVEITKPMGGSTKWLSNKAEIAQVEEQWEQYAHYPGKHRQGRSD